MRKYDMGRIAILLWIFQLISVSLTVAQSNLAERLKFEATGSETPVKCGFPVILEAAASQDASVTALLKQRRWQTIQQLTQTYPSPSGHFLIHYETSGVNAIPAYDRDQNGTPDYLEFVAKSFDRAWQVEIDSLGFNLPPDSTGAPHTVYPVFCKRIQAYGITWFSDPLPPEFYRYDSYIEINTDFSFVTYPDITNDPVVRDSLAIAVTAAHEFNHALQLGYRLWVGTGGSFTDLWYIESSATYMEEVVAQQVNDYFYYLDCIFSSTDLHLTRDNSCNRIYGEVLLFIMLGEVYGKEVTRQIWAEIVNQPALQSLSLILDQKGSSLNKEMQRWAAWMFFSGDYAIPGVFYPEADLYPNPALIELDPAILTQNPNKQVYEGQLPSLSFELFKIPVVAADELLIFIDPLQHSNSWYGSQLDFIEPYHTQFGSNIPYLANFTPPSRDIYLAVTSGDWDMGNSAPNTGYSIQLQATGKVLGEDILVGPNPVRVRDGNALVTFLNLPREAVIEIFSGNGVRVATVEPQEGVPVAQWDLRNFRNDLVGSGVYIYRIVSPQESKTGKFLVIR